MTKDELRKLFKSMKQNMQKSGELHEISLNVTKNILKSDIYKTSIHIALYYPLNSEIDIRGIITDKKNFYLPKCVNNDLFFAKYDENLKSGCFSIPEPQGDIINPEILDVIYIPCLCCNGKNYRLGWGKGFYDNFLNKNNIKAKKIIVSAKNFITDKFIEESHDFRCDDIISDV